MCSTKVELCGEKQKMKMKQNEKGYRYLVALVIFGLFSLLMALSCVDEQTRTNLLRENGPIEIASAAGYFMIPLIMFVKGGWNFLKRHTYLVFLVSALGFRELDFHSRFTTTSITKSRFFFSMEVPFLEKGIAFLVVLILLLSLIVCVKKHWRSFLAGCTKEIVPMTIGIAFLFMAVSKSLDGLPRKLSRFGMDATSRLSLFAQSAEEILEFGIPLLLIIATLAYFSKDPPGVDSARGARENP